MLATLRSIAESVSQQASLDNALVCFVQMVKDAMKTQCCSIYFADYSQDNFVLMATEGLNPGAVGKFRIGFTEGLVGSYRGIDGFIAKVNTNEYSENVYTFSDGENEMVIENLENFVEKKDDGVKEYLVDDYVTVDGNGVDIISIDGDIFVGKDGDGKEIKFKLADIED